MTAYIVPQRIFHFSIRRELDIQESPICKNAEYADDQGLKGAGNTSLSEAYTVLDACSVVVFPLTRGA